MVVGGLLADDRGDHSGDTAEFHVENVVDGLSPGAVDGEGDLAGRLDGDVDEPRLGGGGDKGEYCFRGGRKNVHEEVGWQALRDVGREVEVDVRDFSVFRLRGSLPGHGVDEDVRGFGEGGAALNVVVADETEGTVLGENRGASSIEPSRKRKMTLEVTRSPWTIWVTSPVAM